MAISRLSDPEVEAIVTGRHANPFAVLGIHQLGKSHVARAFVPGAEAVQVFSLAGKPLGTLAARDPAGFFEGSVKPPGGPVELRASNATATWSEIDPYSFGPVLGPQDDYYASEGTHLRLFDKFGAHPIVHQKVPGVHFAVWAPNAERVSVIGDFNAWDGRRHVMRLRRSSGVWEIFIPGIGEGALYKYEIMAGSRLLPLKSDPFAFSSELRPRTASRVARIDNFAWTDGKYLKERASRDWRRSPVSIYEVHLGSWRRNDENGFLSYDDLGRSLIPYVRDLGYTHIELLPISEHPFDPSWGYQPTGLYAPTARFGDPAAFARFVNTAHEAGIGVILDWVPAHFPTDEFGLGQFDGTALYEHEDPRKGYHPDWNTAIYNFGRTEVRNYLINNALFWLEIYHVDGLRVDAVASMLYLDYSRKAGEWIPNQYGGNENLEAIAFLKRVNEVCYAAHPGVMTIAEESTAFAGVSKPTYTGGLGFGFKWNMGFMHDTLQYLAREPVHRKHHHSELTFGLLYAFTENFLLPLSHDEVVHGKGSLLRKMSGDDWQKFATLRAYYSFMWGYPGKKLLFMGQEFAPWDEWSEAKSLDWHLLGSESHQGIQHLIRDLNQLYRELPSLHAMDCEPEGFHWMIADDQQNSVFAWARYAGDSSSPVLVISNFTPIPRHSYALPAPRPGLWRERLNSDASYYGGSGMGNMGEIMAAAQARHGMPATLTLTLPPLATLILEFAGP